MCIVNAFLTDAPNTPQLIDDSIQVLAFIFSREWVNDGMSDLIQGVI